MADSKRQNTGYANAARMKPAPSPASEVDKSKMLAAIGLRVKVTTVLNESIEGYLYAADSQLDMIVIDTAPRVQKKSASNQRADIHIMSTSQLKDFKVNGTTDGSSTEDWYPPVGVVDNKIAQARLESEVKSLQEQEARRKQGVSKEYQEIYDALGRTLPIRWHETSMIVLDAVRIDMPYRVEDCKAGAKDASVLSRVKQILEIERTKLGLASTKPTNTTPIALPVQRGVERKGG